MGWNNLGSQIHFVLLSVLKVTLSRHLNHPLETFIVDPTAEINEAYCSWYSCMRKFKYLFFATVAPYCIEGMMGTYFYNITKFIENNIYVK